MSSPLTLTILYATQTGNAKDVAEQIRRQAIRHGIASVPLRSVDEYPIQLLPTCQLVVFVCSTTGQGQVPDSMTMFWKNLLRKSLPSTALRGVRYTVFGLGDSTYQQFNVCAKRLDARLNQLGAERILVCGDGDDQHRIGYEAELQLWTEALWTTLKQLYPNSVADTVSSSDQLYASASMQPPKRNLRHTHPNAHRLPSNFTLTISSANTSAEQQQQQQQPNHQQLISGWVQANQRITATSHFQDVRHVELAANPTDTNITNSSYGPGWVVAVTPTNPTEAVDEFLNVLKLDGDLLLNVAAASDVTLPPLPSYPCSLRRLCTEYFDITAVPRRYFFEVLSHFAKKDLERDRLAHFGSADGMDDLVRYCIREKRSYIEVLSDFPDTSFPLPYIFDLIPKIQPRSFSISSDQTYMLSHRSSASESAPQQSEAALQLSMTVAVVDYFTPYKHHRKGLCSNWLAALPVGHPIQFQLKPGTFRWPTSVSTPVILVGPGTGCAPFRSFIQSRAAAADQVAGTVSVFLGFRHASKDFLYGDEWLQWKQTGIITNLQLAFSRDQESKVYVQHLIRQNAALLYPLIVKEGAQVFVSGNAKLMPGNVRDAFISVLQFGGSMSLESATQYQQQMAKSGKYQEETW